MATIYHQLRVNAPILRLFKAVSTVEGIATWWDRPVDTPMNVGSVLEFNLGEMHGILQMKVLEVTSGKRIEWECISTHMTTSPASAWTGTRVAFDFTEAPPMPFETASRGQLAVLDFRHSGWDETNKYFGYCNLGWGEALLKLRKVSESK